MLEPTLIKILRTKNTAELAQYLVKNTPSSGCGGWFCKWKGNNEKHEKMLDQALKMSLLYFPDQVMVEILLDHGAEFSRHENCIMSMMADDDTEPYDLLVKMDKQYTTDKSGTTAWNIACLAGNLTWLRHMSKESSEVFNVVDNKLRTGLYYAAKFGHEEVVDLYIEHNQDIKSGIDHADIYGITPLITAVYNGNVDMAKKLLDISPESVNASPSFQAYQNMGKRYPREYVAINQMSLLMIAVSRHDDQMVDLLMQYDPDLDYQYKNIKLTKLARDGSYVYMENGSKSVYDFPMTDPVYHTFRYCLRRPSLTP